MVQVQSSWFPLIDRNPQRFVPSIYAARASDDVAATQRIARTREAPSALALPLLARYPGELSRGARVTAAAHAG